MTIGIVTTVEKQKEVGVQVEQIVSCNVKP
jgi:hypothetical protein